MLRLRALIRLALTTLGALLMVTVVVFSDLVGMSIRLDLHNYAKVVRSADCSLQDKERLLDQIDDLDRQVREGTKIPLLRWIELHTSVSPLLDGLEADEVRLVEREFIRLRSELDVSR